MPDPAFMEIIREQMLAADRDRQLQALQPRHDILPNPSGWNQTQRPWQDPNDPGPYEIPEQDPWITPEREGEIRGWTPNPGYLPQGDTEWGEFYSPLQDSGETTLPQGSSFTQYSLTNDPNPTKTDLKKYAYEMAQKYNIDPWMFMAQMQTEGKWHVDPDKAIFDRDPEDMERIKKFTVGIAQLDTRSHPKELIRLSNPDGLGLTDSDGNPLWEVGRPMDPRNPYDALEYAAKLIWAETTRFRHKKGFHPGVEAFNWKHDPNQSRTREDTQAFRHALWQYNMPTHPTEKQRKEGLDYVREITLLAPELRKELYGLFAHRAGTAYTDEYANMPVGDEFLSRLDTTDYREPYHPGNVWVVRSGDTLSAIADATGVSKEDIMEFNPSIIKDPNNLKASSGPTGSGFINEIQLVIPTAFQAQQRREQNRKALVARSQPPEPAMTGPPKPEG